MSMPREHVNPFPPNAASLSHPGNFLDPRHGQHQYQHRSRLSSFPARHQGAVSPQRAIRIYADRVRDSWDQVYSKELANFKNDSDDEGEVW